MSEHLYCQKPDRDVPETICGYPLPCPWHTVTIHADKSPPTVEVPATVAPLMDREKLARLKQIARTAGDGFGDDERSAG